MWGNFFFFGEKIYLDRHPHGMKTRSFPLLFLAGILLLSCHSAYQPTSVKYAGYGMSDQLKKDASVQAMLKPYADTVSVKMSDVVGQLARKLTKKQVDGDLGHFMADGYLAMARAKFAPAADVAFMNSGGIRLPGLEAGTIRRGTIYELMPFDNTMEILELKGALLQQYLDHIVAKEGGGGVAGVTLTIRDKKATDVKVGGKPLDPAATYVMVNSDYVVNGGGGFMALRDLPRKRTGYFLRDALLDYCEGLTRQGKKIDVLDEKRVNNE
jgi:2',3'-cyclic-nucleotide 2'-phosphodiesterase (5'-nucleotidase family)